MPLGNPRVGLDFTPAYQISGIPFVLSGIVVPALGAEPKRVNFPRVTRRVTIKNDSAVDMRVGFSRNGVTGSVDNNFFILPAGSSFDDEFRIGRLYVISNAVGSGSAATVIANMTIIPSSEIDDNWSGSEGVG